MKAFICTQHGMAFAGSCLTISEEWDIDHGRGQMPSSTHIANKLKLRFSRFLIPAAASQLACHRAPIFSVEDGHRLKGASFSCFESRMQLTVLLGVLVFCFFVMLLIAASRLLPQNPLKNGLPSHFVLGSLSFTSSYQIPGAFFTLLGHNQIGTEIKGYWDPVAWVSLWHDAAPHQLRQIIILRDFTRIIWPKGSIITEKSFRSSRKDKNEKVNLICIFSIFHGASASRLGARNN